MPITKSGFSESSDLLLGFRLRSLKPGLGFGIVCWSGLDVDNEVVWSEPGVSTSLKTLKLLPDVNDIDFELCLNK